MKDNARTIGDIKTERPDLIESIRQFGVLVPPIANETETAGHFAAKDGFSRILASLVVCEEPENDDDANLEIPVIVTTSQNEEEWQRLRDQFIMNELRKGYDSADKARIMEQFTLFGFSDEEIARQLSLESEQVKAGLAVQRSTTAKSLMTEHPQLDLLQLGAITEFEDDEEALARLQDTLYDEPEQFDHEVARLRLKRAEKEALDQLTRELIEQGITVVAKTYDGAQAPLSRLKLSKSNPLELGNSPEAHADCPGHAAWVETVWSSREPRATYICQDWKAHGHAETHSANGSSARQPKSDFEKAELKRARENNASWRAAEEVRRAKLAEIVQRSTPPKRTQQFITTAMIEGTYEVGRALDQKHAYACELLGLPKPAYGKKHPMLSKARKASANGALMFQLAMVLAAFEDRTSVQTWRGNDEAQKEYFSFLRDSCNYPLSAVERLVLDPTEDFQRWPHLQESAASSDTDVAETPANDDDDPGSELAAEHADADQFSASEVNSDGSDAPTLSAPVSDSSNVDAAAELADSAA
ncbi:hypothetical protein E1288_21055 [Saccharopolyspora elongata]|uniref:Uncharacterized protein n=1 Tax=Saccharopolyspora elongata TaxID=2530387 RepID=A0A4R4YVV5_9PSEU|nr:hypothetical protein E1288_21055 [Saccharopolyspora elongata]